jgi:hypothetical protein
MNEKEQEIIDYIMREVVRRSDKQITEDTPLVSSGPFISAREYSSEARRCYPYADFQAERFSRKTWTL